MFNVCTLQTHKERARLKLIIHNRHITITNVYEQTEIVYNIYI